MNVLVTGGAGFIGSNYIYYMQKAHPEIRLCCLDALTYAGNRETLKKAEGVPGFRFVRGDIADEAAVDALFREERFDLAVNFAAESHVDRSVGNPGLFLRTNVLGVQVLMDACRKHSVPRFHQVSTDEVYGELPLERKELRFTEESPLRPSSPYSASKAAADLLVLAYHRTYGLPVTISRCSNNYGPHHFPEKLIPLAVTRALSGGSVPVYGRGDQVRDWLYAEDHCAAVDLISRRGRPGEVYNVGGNSERANLEVVRAILRGLHKPESLIQFVADRPGHDRRYAVDAGKLERELDWHPSVNFEEGLDRTLLWYLENRFWWERILSGEDREYYEAMYKNR